MFAECSDIDYTIVRPPGLGDQPLQDKKIEALNLKITQVQDSLLSIDSLLQDNQKKLVNLRKQYEKNIFIINKFNSNNIASYFTNRYNNK